MARVKHDEARRVKAVEDGKAVEGGEVPPKLRKKHRYKSGTVALRGIKKAQKSGTNLAAPTTFRRLVRHIARDIGKETFNTSDYRITENAFKALQDSSEAFLTGYLRLSGAFARHAGRVQVYPADTRLAQALLLTVPDLEMQSFI